MTTDSLCFCADKLFRHTKNCSITNQYLC